MNDPELDRECATMLRNLQRLVELQSRLCVKDAWRLVAINDGLAELI